MKNICYLIVFSIVIFSSITNAQWVHINGPSSNYINSLVVSSIGEGNIHLFAGTVGSGIFLSTDEGTNWTAMNNGLTENNVSSLAISDTTVFAGTEHTTNNTWPVTNGRIFHSTNNGASWQTADTTLPGEYVKCFAIKDTIIFAGTYIPEGGKVYKSSNNGKTWELILLIPHYYAATCLIIKDSNVFVGSNGGLGGLFRTSDNGENWVKIDSTLGGFSSLMLDGTNLLAGTSTGAYLSADNGLSWSSINNGLPDYVNNYGWITTLAGSSNGDGGSNIFAGTDSAGIFLSTNNGTNWSSIGLTGKKVSALAITETNLFALTEQGIWRLPLSEILTSVNETANYNMLRNYELKQNFPNPFNPVTKISYAIPQNSFVELKVFNLLGQEIATLVNQEKPAGNYEVNFNATNLPSGVYIYKMKSGDYVETRKMVLLK